ncbi:MAG TPA: hypothetical protein VFQ35_26045, partial [Polyangiaceae bacterium]|nr:hypothetical protein [Polyangiaceae bacterium]
MIVCGVRLYWAVRVVSSLSAVAVACTAPRNAAWPDGDAGALPFQFEAEPNELASGVAIDVIEAVESNAVAGASELSFVAGDSVVQYSASGELRRIPLYGGLPTVIASGVAKGSLVTGDARGTYWVTPD